MPDTLTVAIMDAPYEAAASTTAFRIIAAALQKGINVNVFAYEGAVCLPFAAQKQHANAVHGHDLAQEDHPLPREWVSAVMEEAARNGGKLDWVNCGLCVDERGAGQWIDGVKRGSPADFLKMASESTRTLVIPTR